MLSWGEHKLPPGLRSLVGVLLIVAGIFGFLPILGFWMIPVGSAFIGLDIPPLRRRLKQWLAETGPAREARPTMQGSNKAAEETRTREKVREESRTRPL
jgi:hypothetical protein